MWLTAATCLFRKVFLELGKQDLILFWEIFADRLEGRGTHSTLTS